MGLFDRLKKTLLGDKAAEENAKTAEASETTETSKESTESTTETTPVSAKHFAETPTAKKQKPAEEAKPSDATRAEASPANESLKVAESNQSPTSQAPQPAPQTASSLKDETPPIDPSFQSETSNSKEAKSSPKKPAPAKEQGDLVEEVVASDSHAIATETQETKTDEKYQVGLKKSRNNFAARFNRFLANFRSVDQQFFDDLEDFLIESDVGYELAMDLSDQLKEMVKEENLKSKKEIGQAIIAYLIDSYEVNDTAIKLNEHPGLNIYLFVGVNGAGKTTTIGKLANRFQKAGKKVILVAGDTFRAGATEQLDLWAEKTQTAIIKGKPNQDPASLVYEGIHQAQNENADYLMIDTAGRLQNKVNLMKELDKIKRTIKKEAGEDPSETLLVIDATTGQNGLNQAKEFNQVTKLSGLVLSKLDGTAKGGIVLQIKKSLNIPVKLVGLGEKVDDLVDFNPEEFMRGFFKGILEIS